MDIAIVLYDRFTALDAIGPYEVLSRIPGANVRFLAEQPGPVKTDNGVLTVLAEHGLGELEHPDVIVVPGGPGEVDVRAGSRVLEWLRGAHETSTWTTSVCTGSLILAAAGLLRGQARHLPLAGARPPEGAGRRCRARSGSSTTASW